MKIINTTTAPAAIGPYSQGIETNGFIFFSGQIALTPEGNFLDEDIETQTLQVFKNIDALLAEAGVAKTNIVKGLVFFDDLANFAAFNELYATWLNGHKPARSCVQAQLPKGAKVEVEVIAAQA
jgi:2-iminobutanoate/2-iminopropanoate deaminase